MPQPRHDDPRDTPFAGDPELGERFELRRTFGGGEGWSGLVVDRRAGGRECLLKVLDPGEELHEPSLTVSLHHRQIPDVFEIGRTAAGRPFLLREFVAGRTLDECAPLDVDETLALARDLCEVLAFVHLRGILHLDIKPRNVLRPDENGEGGWRLLDFGLAVRGGERGRGGTPFFCSPEILLGLPTDARSDLFSLGALLFCALRASLPPLRRFVERFPREDFFTAAGCEAAELPAPFDAIVRRLVARQPAHRFADAQEVLEALGAGSGRPPLAALEPDPIALFGAAAERAADALPPGADLVLRGGHDTDRRAVALHVACRLGDTTAIRGEGDSVRIVRGGVAAVELTLPPLTAGAIADHLRAAAGLDDAAAASAARHLHDNGVASAADLAEALRRLAERGVIRPDGPRWVWPSALAGRLDLAPLELRAEPSALRAAAAAGHVEAAVATYRAARVEAAADHALRRGLVDGLLLGGEPLRALPLAHDLPVWRARALLDLGEVRAARAAIAALGAHERDDPHAQRLLAFLDYLGGEPRSALQRIERLGAGDPGTALMRATLLGAAGQREEAAAALRDALATLPAEQQPFLRAMASTSLAELERGAGELESALAHHEEALRLYRSLGNARHTATASNNLGVVAKDLGRHPEAIAHLRRARELYAHVRDRTGELLAEANLGIVNLEAGDTTSAIRRLDHARTALSALGVRHVLPLCTALLAKACALAGDRDRAAALIDELDPADDPRVRTEVDAARRALDAAPLERTDSPTAAPTEPMTREPSGAEGSLPKAAFRTFLAVNRRLASEADLDRAMRYLLEAAITLTGARQGYLLVSRPDGMRMEVGSDPGGAGRAFSRSLANKAIQEQRTLGAEDALGDRDLMEMPSVQRLDVRSALCAPFRSASGTAGALYVEHAGRASVFGDDEKELLEILADQAAIAVDRMLHEEQVEEQLQRSRKDLEVAKRSLRRRDTPAMVGTSRPMKALRREIERFAATDLPVLVRGETGTGKELVARALHAQSTRAGGPFVSENCSAIPAELIESELFGHMKGAFTGADADRPGLFELASGGTLFLDEVGDMPPAMQVKLLRALQEGMVRRVGGSQTVPVDVRLVTATHKDLDALIASGEFREDLYYRIAAGIVRVPPLRDRSDDVVALARHFIDRLNREHARTVHLDPRDEARLLEYSWPGNVRELEHVLARAFLLGDGDRLDLGAAPRSPTIDAGARTTAWPVITLQEAEARTIFAALESTGGDKSKAARILGISRTALYDKLKRIERAAD